MEIKQRICIECNTGIAHNNSKYCWDCRVIREQKYRDLYSSKQQLHNKIWYASLSLEQKKELIQKRYDKYKKAIYDGRSKVWE